MQYGMHVLQDGAVGSWKVDSGEAGRLNQQDGWSLVEMRHLNQVNSGTYLHRGLLKAVIVHIPSF